MEFCDECGSMMKAEDGLWVCGSCEFSKPRGDASEYIITEDQEASEIIESSTDQSTLPKSNVPCPECDNDQAFWYLQQIRSADESETRFFICTECEHKWREDDH